MFSRSSSDIVALEKGLEGVGVLGGMGLMLVCLFGLREKDVVAGKSSEEGQRYTIIFNYQEREANKRQF